MGPIELGRQPGPLFYWRACTLLSTVQYVQANQSHHISLSIYHCWGGKGGGDMYIVQLQYMVSCSFCHRPLILPSESRAQILSPLPEVSYEEGFKSTQASGYSVLLKWSILRHKVNFHPFLVLSHSIDIKTCYEN